MSNETEFNVKYMYMYVIHVTLTSEDVRYIQH